MRFRIGVVQSTSSVVFLGIEIMGDWCAMLGFWIELTGRHSSENIYPAAPIK